LGRLIELADTSAWTNRHKDAHVLADFNARIARGHVATCDMVKLELLWSARDHADFVSLRGELDALPAVPIEPPLWRRAITVLEAIAASGPLHHRRMRIPDLLIAAAAEFAGMPVCHYDRDFELIAKVTGQPVRAIAPLGSL
jgi:predicted nucleic acid-binding protein